MAEEKKFKEKEGRVEIQLNIHEKGDEFDMNRNSVVYDGMPRGATLMIQRCLINLEKKLNDLGYAAEIEKGRMTQEEVDLMKAAAEAIVPSE